MQIKALIWYHSTLTRIIIVKKIGKRDVWLWCKQTGNHKHCWWECKTMPIWKIFCQFHMLIINLLYNSGILGIYQSRTKCWRRQWHPTPVLLPGKSHGRRSLVGCSPWGHEESDMTEWLHLHFSLSCIGEGNGNPLQCSCLESPRDGGAICGGCHLWGCTELDTTEAT